MSRKNTPKRLVAGLAISALLAFSTPVFAHDGDDEAATYAQYCTGELAYTQNPDIAEVILAEVSYHDTDTVHVEWELSETPPVTNAATGNVVFYEIARYVNNSSTPDRKFIRNAPVTTSSNKLSGLAREHLYDDTFTYGTTLRYEVRAYEENCQYDSTSQSFTQVYNTVATSTGGLFREDGVWNESYGILGDTYHYGDFTGDGKGDVILATSRTNENNTYAWYLLQGNGSEFTDGGLWNQSFGLNTDTYYASDFNGDSKTDIVVSTTRINANPNVTDDLAWYLMKSNGSTFMDGGQINSSYGVASDKYYVADFNGDNRDDMIISTTRVDANPNVTDDLAWYLMKSNGSTFLDGGQINSSYGVASDKYYVSDFDGNNRDDMLVATSRINENESLSWYLMNSNGTMYIDGGQKNMNYGSGSQKIYVGDVTNDGKDDVVFANYNSELGGHHWYVLASESNMLVDKGKWHHQFGGQNDMFLIGDVTRNAGADIIAVSLNEGDSLKWSVMYSAQQ